MTRGTGSAAFVTATKLANRKQSFAMTAIANTMRYTATARCTEDHMLKWAWSGCVTRNDDNGVGGARVCDLDR